MNRHSPDTPLLPTFAGSHQDIAPLLNTISHCDAFELLARLPDASVDMALLDLPYGVTACKWDTPLPLEPMWAELKRVCKPRAAMVFTATQPFTSRLVSSNYEMFRYEIVWDKKFAGNFILAKKRFMLRHEGVLIFGLKEPRYYPQMVKRGKPNQGGGMSKSDAFNNNMVALGKIYELKFPDSILHFPRELGMTIHPTQKPVALFEYLIKTYTQEGEIVLDFVCGSGTTAIAARRCNRQFICGDITQEYVEMARKRLQDTDPFQSTELSNGMKQLSLFEETA